MTKKHKHYWHYPHTIWQGRKDSEISVARYCSCGEKQIAFASEWQAIPKSFPDVRDECQKEIDRMQVDAWARKRAA